MIHFDSSFGLEYIPKLETASRLSGFEARSLLFDIGRIDSAYKL